ncbi:uncharacterized protein TRAVEDRAFT_27699 [Trametes versicolor FP-101664 SS1]|uniref:uncharacterized protein n=1 Tax=Trametes versicolor (strain FP-101664) TaxID=717944 RepID=UPI00046220F0|nr:uncharacterized protein TRAVEDRAFT_27699 [Trametes versicolor FP-101664 SS1]EIW62379.1 hypothetical protein TRAVEDRAFT_27699 [Trametes versicolor FP-101664 SS1]
MEAAPARRTAPGGPSRVRCYNCNKTGHYSRECRAPRKQRPQGLHILDGEGEGEGESEDERTGEDEGDEEYEEDMSELNVLNLSDGPMSQHELPIYFVQIPSRREMYRAKLRRTSTIIDTGAARCYIKPSIVRALGLEEFPITTRVIHGAGTTSTSALAKFKVKIGGVVRPMMAYVLDNDRLRYELVIGQDWLKRHNAQPDWATSSWFITDPATHQTTRLSASSPPGTPTAPALPSRSPSLDLGPDAAYSRRRRPLSDDDPSFDGSFERPASPELLPLDRSVRSLPLRNALSVIAFVLLGRLSSRSCSRRRCGTRTFRTGASCTSSRPRTLFLFEDMGVRTRRRSTKRFASSSRTACGMGSSSRICVDYRKQQLHGARFFTTLDLKSGYWQIPIHPRSREKTACHLPELHERDPASVLGSLRHCLS